MILKDLFPLLGNNYEVLEEEKVIFDLEIKQMDLEEDQL